MRDPDERAASQAVRNAGPKPLRRAVEWYRSHDRLHTGDELTMANDALTNYQVDLAAGKDALLMTDSWEVCDALNTRLHGHTVAADAPTVIGARGHHIGAGDVIITRLNDATVPVFHANSKTAADPVRNGHRWRVYAVDPHNNRIAARRIGDNARAAFSGEYLSQHVHHGYAVTVHASQGATAGDALTAGTAHAVLSDRATRNLAYVAVTRGRDANHVYLYEKTAGQGDHEHAELDDQGVHVANRGTSRDAATLLRTVLARDDQPRTVMATAADTDRAHQPAPVRSLRDQHDRVRARLRADYRAHTQQRGGDDLAADLPPLRSEIDFLDSAGRRYAPATGYPTDTLSHLDQAHRRAVTGITRSLQAVQCLHLYPGADKPAALAALAASAKHEPSHRVLALPATPQATEYAAQHRYAETTRKPDHALDKLQTGHWKLPIGSLVIVDDADHLKPDQLGWLAEHAAATNTKLLLIAAPDHRRPAHALTAAADHLLLWAQQLGSPDTGHQRPRSAIERADHHLTTEPPAASPEHTTARELLQRRDQLLDHFRDIANIAAQFDAAARSHERSRGNDYGLEL